MLNSDFTRSIAEWQKQRIVNEMQRVDRLEIARVAVEEQLVASTQAVMENLQDNDDQPAALQICCAVQECFNKAVSVSDKTLKMTLEGMGYNPNEPIEIESTENRFEQMDEQSRVKITDAASALLTDAAVQVEGVRVDGNTGEVLETD